MNINKFIKECSRREVFKLLSIYVVFSWVILQVLALIAEPIGLPAKSISILILLLIIGFPIYIMYIWKSRLSNSWSSEEEDSSLELINKSKFRQMYFTSVGIILFLSGLFATIIFKNTFSSGISLPKIASNDKIAVLKFENNTINDKFDGIGEMAADWISHGITENNAGQIISEDVVNDYSDAMKTQNKAFSSSEILSKFFNPGKRIIGNYFLDGDNLIFLSSIVDGISGKTIISLEQVTCNSSSPLDCIEELRQKIVGFLMIDKDGKLNLETKPPKYEAYKALLEAKARKREGNNTKYLELLNNSIELDTEYFEPRSLKIGYYYNNGPYTVADSLIKSITQTTGISERQQMQINLYKAALEGDNRKVYLFNDYEFKITPLDLDTNTSHMVIALQFVNKPKDVEAIYKTPGNFDEFSLDNCSQCIDRIHLMSLAHNDLLEYSKTITLLEPYLDIIKDRFFLMPIFRAYLRTNNKQKADDLLGSLKLKIDQKDWLYITLFIAREHILQGQKEAAKPYLNTVINTEAGIGNEELIAESNYELGNYQKAESLYINLYESNPNNPKVISGLSMSLFKNGKTNESNTLIDKLNTLRKPYQYGEIDYRLAQIYSAQNNEAKVFEHLLKSISDGNFYTDENFKNSSSFAQYINSDRWNEVLTYWH